MEELNNNKETDETKEVDLEKNPENSQEISNEQAKTHNKILRNIFIFIGVFVLFIVLAVYWFNSINSFKYRGVDFRVVKEGELIFYQTSIPVGYKDKITGQVVSADYNFYLRNDPRKLENKVLIEGGDISFRKNMVLELTSEELYCQGDWMLALHNAVNLYNLLGFNLIVENESIAYIPIEDYMFIVIQESNVTNINKIGESTYEINVNDCEVLAVFERLMIETFVKCKEVGCGWT